MVMIYLYFELGFIKVSKNLFEIFETPKIFDFCRVAVGFSYLPSRHNVYISTNPSSSMDLRELKKEVHSLPDLSEHLQKFQQNWLKPIKSNTNKQLPFLQHLPVQKKQEINTQLFFVQQKIKEIESSRLLSQKLQQYAHYLVELKLTTLNGNQAKAHYITNLLLKDQFLNTSDLIQESRYLEKNVKSLTHKYHHINGLMQKHAPLEEAVQFMHLPHQEHLQALLAVSKKQKVIFKQLGEHFLSLAKQTKRKK